MKRIALLAAVAAVAACSKPAPETATAEQTAEAAAPAAATLAADGKPSVGTFEVTDADGKKMTEVVAADGTYSDTDASGKVVETGKWEQKSPTEYCFTKDGEGAKQVCNVEGIDAKGVWTSKSPEGKVATVVRVGT